MALWLAISGTLVNGTFPATTTYADTEYAETYKESTIKLIIMYFLLFYSYLTLLCTESQTTSFIGTCGPWCAVHLRQLAILPYSHTQQEAQYVRLLLAIQLLNVLVGAHGDGPASTENMT